MRRMVVQNFRRQERQDRREGKKINATTHRGGEGGGGTRRPLDIQYVAAPVDDRCAFFTAGGIELFCCRGAGKWQK